jgi:hypothetical protein
MDLKKIITDVKQIRADVQALLGDIKGGSPHLSNAAGALGVAINNLEGHAARPEEKSETAAG